MMSSAIPSPIIFLLRVAAHVLEREHRDRRPVRCRGRLHRSFRRVRRRRRRFLRRRGPDLDRIDTHRLGNILEFGRAEIADRNVEPRPHLPIRLFGQADRAGLGDPFESRGDVDRISHQIAVALLGDVADVNADAEFDASFGRQAGVALDHAVLHFDRAAHRIHHAAELDDRAVAGAFDQAPVMHSDRRIDEVASERPQPRERAILRRRPRVG